MQPVTVVVLMGTEIDKWTSISRSYVEWGCRSRRYKSYGRNHAAASGPTAPVHSTNHHLPQSVRKQFPSCATVKVAPLCCRLSEISSCCVVQPAATEGGLTRALACSSVSARCCILVVAKGPKWQIQQLCQWFLLVGVENQLVGEAVCGSWSVSQRGSSNITARLTRANLCRVILTLTIGFRMAHRLWRARGLG